jgi:hypothetical protein
MLKKMMSKRFKKDAKKSQTFVKKLLKSCQKDVKKLSKNCHKKLSQN